MYILHHVPISPNKVSFCLHSPAFSHLYLAPSPLSLYLSLSPTVVTGLTTYISLAGLSSWGSFTQSPSGGFFTSQMDYLVYGRTQRETWAEHKKLSRPIAHIHWQLYNQALNDLVSSLEQERFNCMIQESHLWNFEICLKWTFQARWWLEHLKG